MKLGIRAHDINQTNPIELANSLENHHLEFIQLVLNKAFPNLPSNHLSIDLVNHIIEPFKQKSINIALLGAYFNPVHSDFEKVKANIKRFKEHLKYASYFNTRYVATETGSYNDDKWTYNPKNHTEEAYLKVKTIVQELVISAKEYNATVLIEGAYNHVIYNPYLLKRLIDDINSPHLKVIVDLFNYLNIDNYHQYKTIFETCLNLLKDNIVVFHMKDFIIQDNKLVQVGLGEGIIDFDYIIVNILKAHQDAYLILEGITGYDIKTSINLLKSLEKKYE